MLTDSEINRRIVVVQAAIGRANQDLIDLLSDIAKEQDDGHRENVEVAKELEDDSVRDNRGISPNSTPDISTA